MREVDVGLPEPLPQCVFLVGGLGTRLGDLTRATPKPLLEVGGRPFLHYLLEQARRHGFRQILLLAGYRADSFAEYLERANHSDLDIRIVAEPTPSGTGGALKFAADHLAESFVLLNGDSWFDFDWTDIVSLGTRDPEALVAMALRQVPDGGRYGVAILKGDQVLDFIDRGTPGEPGIINAGVCFCRKSLLAEIGAASSLEREVLPRLARSRRVAGRVYDGFFLDIGVPESFSAAQTLVPAQARRTRM